MIVSLDPHLSCREFIDCNSKTTKHSVDASHFIHVLERLSWYQMGCNKTGADQMVEENCQSNKGSEQEQHGMVDPTIPCDFF